MKTFTTALFASTVFAFFTQQAMAVEPAEFMERMAALFENSGSEISYDAVEGDATSFTVRNVVMDPQNQEIKGGIPLGNITVKNIQEGSDGLYTAEQIIADDVDSDKDDLSVLATGMSVSDIELPVISDGAFIFYKDLTVKNVDVSFKGVEWFKMRDLIATMDGNADRSIGSGDLDVASLTLNLGEIVDERTKPILAEMGYSTLNGTMGMDLNWDLNGGNMSIKDYFLDVQDAGRLTLDLALDGYTMEFARSLAEISKNQDQNAAGVAMMGLMQQLSYVGAGIKFEDNSLTNKVLDFQAAKQGTDRTALVGMAKAIIPFTLAQLNKPEFTKDITAAIGAFLDNPKSLEITANPSEPIPAFELAAAGSTAPQNLIDVLDVQVKANQ